MSESAAPATPGDRLRLEPGWKRALEPAFGTPRSDELRQLLRQERAGGTEIYPPMEHVVAAFDHTPLDAVRVVIVGQDPYHGPGQAMGLSFSVPRGVPQPPSLRNVLKELAADVGCTAPQHGDLTAWADQGVLLLNSSLTVRAHEAGSHANAGWEPITDAAISAVSAEREHVVFLLWGRHAQSKAQLVDTDKHLVLRAAHPSPLSASKGFFGCRHFSKANAWLHEHGEREIDWQLPA